MCNRFKGGGGLIIASGADPAAGHIVDEAQVTAEEQVQPRRGQSDSKRLARAGSQRSDLRSARAGDLRLRQEALLIRMSTFKRPLVPESEMAPSAGTRTRAQGDQHFL